MRFLLLSKADIQGSINLNDLLPLLAPAHEVRILLSDLVLASERGHTLAERITYHDRDFILNSFFPALDRMRDSDFATTPNRLYTFNALARLYQSPIDIIPHHERNIFLEQEIRVFKPDVILCCRHDYILKETMINSAEYGAYNLHSGPLPEYRGPQAPFWVMHMQLEKTACTLHCMTSEIDAGNIIAQPDVPLDYSHSVFWNRMYIYKKGIYAFAALLAKLQTGPLSGTPQNQIFKRYFGVPSKSELDTFEKKGQYLVTRKDYEEILTRYLPHGLTLDDLGYAPDPGCV